MAQVPHRRRHGQSSRSNAFSANCTMILATASTHSSRWPGDCAGSTTCTASIPLQTASPLGPQPRNQMNSSVSGPSLDLTLERSFLRRSRNDLMNSTVSSPHTKVQSASLPQFFWHPVQDSPKKGSDGLQSRSLQDHHHQRSICILARSATPIGPMTTPRRW